MWQCVAAPVKSVVHSSGTEKTKIARAANQSRRGWVDRKLYTAVLRCNNLYVGWGAARGGDQLRRVVVIRLKLEFRAVQLRPVHT